MGARLCYGGAGKLAYGLAVGADYAVEATAEDFWWVALVRKDDTGSLAA
jgi:hypothetical protein